MALAFLILLAAQPEPPVLATHDFHAFEAGCDNVRNCRAVGFPLQPREDSDPLGAGLIIDREGAASSPVTIELGGLDLEDFSGTIRVDGSRETWSVARNDVRVRGDTLALARALAATSGGARLVGADGKVKARLPTQGAAAALRWIDEQQKRTGTATAIVARGVGSASAIPPQPALPHIKTPRSSSRPPTRMRATDLARFREQYGCETDIPAADPVYRRLDARHTLATFSCNLGAYQASSLVILVPDRGPPVLAPLETPWPGGADADEHPSIVLGGDEGAPDGLLWEEAVGRGLGDCGVNRAWAWDGARFALAFYSVMDRCDGMLTRIPLFRSANAPE